jgi:hypothetical protein
MVIKQAIDTALSGSIKEVEIVWNQLSCDLSQTFVPPHYGLDSAAQRHSVSEASD